MFALDYENIYLKAKYEHDVMIEQSLKVEHAHCVENMQNEAYTSKSSCACESSKIKNDNLNNKLDDL